MYGSQQAPYPNNLLYRRPTYSLGGSTQWYGSRLCGMPITARVWNHQNGRKLCSKQFSGGYAGSGLCGSICTCITTITSSHHLFGVPKQIWIASLPTANHISKQKPKVRHQIRVVIPCSEVGKACLWVSFLPGRGFGVFWRCFSAIFYPVLIHNCSLVSVCKVTELFWIFIAWIN